MPTILIPGLLWKVIHRLLKGFDKMLQKRKYNNSKIVLPDGNKFDSKKEFARWQQLLKMQEDGLIENLERQVAFEIVPSVRLGGRKQPARKYIADFVYEKDGVRVVEDSKGFRDAIYRLKKHLMMSVHQIEILET